MRSVRKWASTHAHTPHAHPGQRSSSTPRRPTYATTTNITHHYHHPPAEHWRRRSNNLPLPTPLFHPFRHHYCHHHHLELLRTATIMTPPLPLPILPTTTISHWALPTSMSANPSYPPQPLFTKKTTIGIPGLTSSPQYTITTPLTFDQHGATS